jgi:hypothetical protein
LNDLHDDQHSQYSSEDHTSARSDISSTEYDEPQMLAKQKLKKGKRDKRVTVLSLREFNSLPGNEVRYKNSRLLFISHKKEKDNCVKDIDNNY